MSQPNLTNQRGNECNLFHALKYLHTHIHLHGFNNCYNLCHLPQANAIGKNKMVTSGYEFWGEIAYVCYLIYLFNFLGY